MSLGDAAPAYAGAAAPPSPHRLSALEDLLAAYLVKFPPSTRAAYRNDLASWLAFCENSGVDVLRAGINHADIYLRRTGSFGAITNAFG